MVCLSREEKHPRRSEFQSSIWGNFCTVRHRIVIFQSKFFSMEI